MLEPMKRDCEPRSFGERLEELIGEKSIDFIADEIGISSSSIRGYIKGTKTPGIDKLVMLAEYFEVSYDYLLGKSKAKKRENIEVCGYLGLDEEAVDIIKFIASNSNKLENDYSTKIFSNDLFITLVDYINLACIAAKDHQIEFQWKDNENDERSRTHFEVEQYSNAHDVLLGDKNAVIAPAMRLDLIRVLISDVVQEMIADIVGIEERQSYMNVLIK